MLKLLVGFIAAALLLWVGATGRLGSLLGALVTPAYMSTGTPPTNGSSASGNNSDFTVQPGGIITGPGIMLPNPDGSCNPGWHSIRGSAGNLLCQKD